MAVGSVTSRIRRSGSLAKIRPVSGPPDDHVARPRPAGRPADRSAGVGGPTTLAPSERIGADGPGRRGDLVLEAVAAALASLEALGEHSRAVALEFRSGRTAAARRGLADLVQSTQTLIRLAVMTAAATGGTDQAFAGSEGHQADEDTRVAVDSIIGHQLSGDWSGLADTLEGRFPAALHQWRAVFERFGRDAGDPGPGDRAA